MHEPKQLVQRIGCRGGPSAATGLRPAAAGLLSALASRVACFTRFGAGLSAVLPPGTLSQLPPLLGSPPGR